MTARIVPGLCGTVLTLAAVLPVTAAADSLTGLRPAEPQPSAQQLVPGLAVEYAYAIVNHVDELKGKKFESGPPLTHLNWKMGYGTVLTSKASDGVGAIITGFIQFEKAGIYGFDVTSNDGVRVEVSGKLLYEDPGVHADDTSERIDVKIERPGWYPIRIVYFEKRNTATLVLRWIGPGETGKLAPVPAKALAHLRR
jgi:hypothetical protein